MVPFWRCTTRRRRAVSSPSVVLREMVSFDTTKTNSLGAWRGVGAWTASRFMASRALSWGARTNGAVCAAPGGSRHHLYHRLSFLRWEEALSWRAGPTSWGARTNGHPGAYSCL